MLDKKEINHLAELARLSLTDTENEALQKDLSGILDYVDQLANAKIESLPEALMGLNQNQVRLDSEPIVNDTLANSIIEHFPQKDGRSLKIPPVF